MAQNSQLSIPNGRAKLDQMIDELRSGASRWAQTTCAERIAVLTQIKDNLIVVSPRWVKAAAQHKSIPETSALVGEEWLSGPYALMGMCNDLINTLSKMDDKEFLKDLAIRQTISGQIAVKIQPLTVFDHILLSGISAEVWMQQGVDKANLSGFTASAYDSPPEARRSGVALVLGAGNIAAIAPLDAFQKLFSEHAVVLLKMNPVNEYLAEFLEIALKPLIDLMALRIVKGGAEIGRYLCAHDGIDTLHITGSEATHDAIVWGNGPQAAKNKASNTPIFQKPITSELGAVCPTIVVPGPWSKADLRFQAEHIATQKMHNSGFNCIACQVLILPELWEKTPELMLNLRKVFAKLTPRAAYYPGAKGRMKEYEKRSENANNIGPLDNDPVTIISQMPPSDPWFCTSEIFAPALSTHKIKETDPEKYLRAAIEFANDKLYGTLGANILIHPKTIRMIGRKNFDQLLSELKYGTIGVNAWTGLGFLLTVCPWGAYPGHSLENIQSGVGFVHNAFMFDAVEKTVLSAPFRPFPRNILSGGTSLLPRPPWFVTNSRQNKIGQLLTSFKHRPSWLKLPRILINALLG